MIPNERVENIVCANEQPDVIPNERVASTSDVTLNERVAAIA